MDNKRLTLYYIDSDYINYLREFDNRVPYNKKCQKAIYWNCLCF